MNAEPISTSYRRDLRLLLSATVLCGVGAGVFALHAGPAMAAVYSTAARTVTDTASPAHAAGATTVFAEPDPKASGLTLDPASGLFNTVLEPGAAVFRSITMTNTTAHALPVAMNIDVHAPSDTPSIAEHIQLTAGDAACSDEFDPSRTLAAGTTLQLTAIPAHSSRTVCLGVMLPANSATPSKTRTVVDFRFTTTPGTSEQQPPGLAFTGAGLTLISLVAFLTVGGGTLVLLARRHRARRTAPTR